MAATGSSVIRRMYNALVEARFQSVEREIARVRIYRLDGAERPLSGSSLRK